MQRRIWLSAPDALPSRAQRPDRAGRQEGAVPFRGESELGRSGRVTGQWPVAIGHRPSAIACCRLPAVGGRWRLGAASKVCERECPSTVSRGRSGLGESPASGKWPLASGHRSMATRHRPPAIGHRPPAMACCPLPVVGGRGGVGAASKVRERECPSTVSRSRRGLSESPPMAIAIGQRPV
jgi:hypothetical protein